MEHLYRSTRHWRKKNDGTTAKKTTARNLETEKGTGASLRAGKPCGSHSKKEEPKLPPPLAYPWSLNLITYNLQPTTYNL